MQPLIDTLLSIILLGQQIPANGSESGPFVATFDAQGGSPTPPTQSVVAGQHLTAPASPTRDGYNFVGWTKNLVTQEIFNFSTETLTSDITLYAVWQSTSTSNPGGYYNGITATGGVELINQLKTLITGNLDNGGIGKGNTNYGTANEILVYSDVNINNASKLWGVYDGAALNNEWDSGATWNKEHVWPNSRLGVERVGTTQRNQASDPHNLRACLKSTNETRSNHFFVQGSGVNGITGAGYYPGDEHRGDVARILLYMAVRYRGTLTLVDTQSGTNYQSSGANLATLSILLGWHQADPVDAFEIQRNDVIQTYQGNRNPFIDNPNYFEPVWNQLVLEAQQASGKSAQFNATIITYDILKTTYTPTQTRYTI